MLLVSISIFITLAFCIPKAYSSFLTPLKRQKLLDPSNHELMPPSWLQKKSPGHYYTHTDSATFSVPSHAHDQTITCDNFY